MQKALFADSDDDEDSDDLPLRERFTRFFVTRVIFGWVRVNGVIQVTIVTIRGWVGRSTKVTSNGNILIPQRERP